MKKIVLMLGILLMFTSCANMEEIKAHLAKIEKLGEEAQKRKAMSGNGNTYADRAAMSERIKKAYGVQESKGQAKWDFNYNDIMY